MFVEAIPSTLMCEKALVFVAQCLLVCAFLVTTVSAISLLPHVTVGDGSESRASTAYGTIAMSALTRKMGGNGDVCQSFTDVVD